MKNLSWRLSLVAGLSALALLGNPIPALAGGGGQFGPGGQGGQGGQGGPDDRLQRLEQRINELADRQEQLMSRLSAMFDNGPQTGVQPGGQGQFQGPMGRRGGPAAQFQGPMGRRGGMAAQFQGPMAAPASVRIAPLNPGGPNIPLAERHPRLAHLVGLILVCGVVCNILLAVWIFTDIRKRGEGSGIFIALALIAGIPTAIIYSLVRIGDKAAEAKKTGT